MNRYELHRPGAGRDSFRTVEATDDAAALAATQPLAAEWREACDLRRLGSPSAVHWRFEGGAWQESDALRDFARNAANLRGSVERMEALVALAVTFAGTLRGLGVPEHLAQPERPSGGFSDPAWKFERASKGDGMFRDVDATLRMQFGAYRFDLSASDPPDVLSWQIEGRRAGLPFFDSGPSHPARKARVGRVAAVDGVVTLPAEVVAVLRYCLGVPADAATRQARIDAHAAFDRVWSGGAKGARQRAYSWLAAKMGRDVVHIGEMTVAECVEVVAHCEALMAEGGEQ